jgi:hypothetical protein
VDGLPDEEEIDEDSEQEITDQEQHDNPPKQDNSGEEE